MSTLVSVNNGQTVDQGIIRIGDTLVNLAQVERIDLDGASIMVCYESGEETEWEFKDVASAREVFDELSATCAAKLFGQDDDLYPDAATGDEEPSRLTGWGVCRKVMLALGGIALTGGALMLVVDEFRHFDWSGSGASVLPMHPSVDRVVTTIILVLMYVVVALQGLKMILRSVCALTVHFISQAPADTTA